MEVAMRSRLSYVLRFSLALLVIGLFIAVPNAQARGTAGYEVHCPIIHVWGETDDPIPEPSGLFVGGAFTNLTTGFSYAYYPPVTPSGAVYTFDETIDLSRVTT